jgi:choline transporter-like protein 2/4/5
VSSRFITSTLSVFFVPLFIFVLTVAFYIYWVAVSVFVYSAGEIKSNGSSPIATVTWDDTTRYAWWYHLFGLFWVNAFLNALNQFVIASTACIWYFEQDRDSPDKTRFPVLTSFYRAFRYHLGSLAFGSLIIAIIQFMIAVLEYIKQKVGDSAGEKVKLIKCLINCCQCILDCCARFIEFINRHAYIQVKNK